MAPTWIETDTNTNVNISSATAVGVYTSTGDKFVMPQLLADQVAGSGDYVYYVTLQVNGAGSAYVIGPKTTHTAAAGETAIGAQGGFIAVRSGDVVTVYIDGLAGDTAIPDVTVRWFELDASANVTMWTGNVAPAAPPSKAELDAGLLALVGEDGDTLESLSDQLDGIPTTGAAGAGAIAHTITVDDGANPLDGAEVWISTDEAGANVVAGTLSTDALGQVTFLLDAGTYWKHVQLAGYNFTATAFTVA